MRCLFYDDPPASEPVPASLFLAGPTARGVERTAWRARTLELLADRGFHGTVIIPEFRTGKFEERAPVVFGKGSSPVLEMRATSYDILVWETAGIEQSTVVLFWMPFQLAEETSPDSLPGFTTRAEVARELQRDPTRIALGMPPGALSSAHIRYHAHQAGVPIAATLEATLEAALHKLERSAP